MSIAHQIPKKTARPVLLRCPTCQRKKVVAADETDPPNVAVIEMVCDRHEGFDDIRYYDQEGKPISLESTRKAESVLTDP